MYNTRTYMFCTPRADKLVINSDDLAVDDIIAHSASDTVSVIDPLSSSVLLTNLDSITINNVSTHTTVGTGFLFVASLTVWLV